MVIDAVIILGKGVETDGTVPTIVQHELDYVLSLHGQQPIPLVIVSGQQWGLEPARGLLSEAVVMANYLKEQAQGSITVELEDQSLDTIGNLVFSKQILDAHQAKHILVVSTVPHLSRVQYIVSQLFDTSYHFSYHGHQHVYTPLEYLRTWRYELCARLYVHWFWWKFHHQATHDMAAYLGRHHFMYHHSLFKSILTSIIQRPRHR